MIADPATPLKSRLSIDVSFDSRDDSRRMIYGYVLVSNIVDSDGMVYNGDELEKAVERFMLKYRERTGTVDTNHENKDKLAIIESKIETWGDDNKRWWVGVKVLDDQEWANIMTNGVNGFSFTGDAWAVPLNGKTQLYDLDITEISALYPTPTKANIPANPGSYVEKLLKSQKAHPAQLIKTLSTEFINLFKGEISMKPEEVQGLIDAKFKEAKSLLDGIQATVTELATTLRTEFANMLKPLEEKIAGIVPQAEQVALQKSQTEATAIKAVADKAAGDVAGALTKVDEALGRLVQLEKSINELSAKGTGQMTPEQIAAAAEAAKHKAPELTGLDRTIAARTKAAAGGK